MSEPHGPDKSVRRRLTEPWAIILAAIITGVFAVVALGGLDTGETWTPQLQTFNGVEMVRVPPGCFLMGNDEGDDDEKPVHTQCVPSFWIDRFEVTNAQFGSVGCDRPPSEPEHPRQCVNWFKAKAHCESRGARLPTEREWEYAARGRDSLIFPWGNNLVADNVVYGGNSDLETADVGSRPGGVSWVGAMDMSGNVWEWVSTIFDQEHYPYPYDPNDGREDLEGTGGLRVLRGGDFGNLGDNLRAANRGWGYDHFADSRSGFGFRCARSF